VGNPRAEIELHRNRLEHAEPFPQFDGREQELRASELRSASPSARGKADRNYRVWADRGPRTRQSAPALIIIW
jgi:hypothetical protein